MRPSPVGRLTHLRPGSGATFHQKHKTTSASLRTTLEFPVCLIQRSNLTRLAFYSAKVYTKFKYTILVNAYNNKTHYYPPPLSSQVGRCWKVQRVHDPDVLNGNLLQPLKEV